VCAREHSCARGKKAACNKGTEAEARADSKPTLIRRAFDLRASKVLLRKPVGGGAGNAAGVGALSVPTAAPLTVYQKPCDRASDRLKDGRWIQAVQAELGHGVRKQGNVVKWSKPNGECRRLSLVLKRKPFHVMISGEKTVEYRKNTRYWRRRLCNKDGTLKVFDAVEFALGYQKNRRKFSASLPGILVVDYVNKRYSNGLHVHHRFQKRGYFAILLGSINQPN